MVVDYRELGGSTATACATDGGGESAAAVFASVGVDLTYAARQPGFVCRVEGVPTSDPCVNTSPTNAYWGLWWSDGSSGSWTYSSSGVGSLTVPAGGSVAWSWQQDRGGSPAAPAVAPPVGLASPSATPTPSQSPSATPSTGGNGGSGGGSGAGGGNGGGQTGGTTAGASPSASPSATTSASPSATPEQDPSASASPRPKARTKAKPGKAGKAGTEDPSASADPTGAPTDEAGDGPSGDASQGVPTGAGASADEPARVPAAVTWGIVALLALALAGSAVVARRRRGTGTQ
ncbi:hypothetical protein NOZE110980_03610 [Nocardioides zeicaulis]